MERMFMWFRKRSGFTLIELIIVVIIIGVLAAIALPQYTGFVERARASEAFAVIGAVKTAEEATRMATGAYVACANAAAINTNLGIVANVTNWTYAVTVPAAGQILITATRTAANGGTAGQTLTLTYTAATGASVHGGTHPAHM